MWTAVSNFVFYMHCYIYKNKTRLYYSKKDDEKKSQRQIENEDNKDEEEEEINEKKKIKNYKETNYKKSDDESKAEVMYIIVMRTPCENNILSYMYSACSIIG